jgi:hypothetical protein
VVPDWFGTMARLLLFWRSKIEHLRDFATPYGGIRVCGVRPNSIGGDKLPATLPLSHFAILFLSTSATAARLVMLKGKQIGAAD